MNIIQTAKAPAAIGPYSQAVREGRFVHTSGQIPLHPETGRMVQETFAKEVEQVLLNLKEVLAAAGCVPKNVLKTTVFMTDLGLFSEFNEIYGKFFGDHKPARSTVQVAALPKGARIEIEAMAVLP
jgi:2-iminobutanoate/2-iminopropanoate deaminase